MQSSPPTRRLAQQYSNAIEQIVKRIVTGTFSPDLTFDQWFRALQAKANRPDIVKASEFLAQNMVRWVNLREARTWREAASRSTQGQKLYRLLLQEMKSPVGSAVSRMVRENAAYIRSIPLEVAVKVTADIQKAQMQGSRPETMAKMLKVRFPKMLKSRTQLIARTEAAKASAVLTKARATALGINWYIWRTSEDSRVRSSHRIMDDVLVSYEDPPNPDKLAGIPSALGRGQSGEFPNCRCTQLPMLDVNTLKFPRRVHYRGQIRVMSKSEFLKIA